MDRTTLVDFTSNGFLLFCVKEKHLPSQKALNCS